MFFFFCQVLTDHYPKCTHLATAIIHENYDGPRDAFEVRWIERERVYRNNLIQHDEAITPPLPFSVIFVQERGLRSCIAMNDASDMRRVGGRVIHVD